MVYIESSEAQTDCSTRCGRRTGIYVNSIRRKRLLGICVAELKGRYPFPNLFVRHIVNTAKKEMFRRTLQNLAESQAVTLELLEKTFVLIGDELSIDAVTFWRTRTAPATSPVENASFHVDPDRLQITFQGKACELSDTPFRLLLRLAKRPNAYVTYEDLLADVWDGDRSDGAVRSAIKRLRHTLRSRGLSELADAIDGSKPGRYRLNVDL